MQQTYHVVDDQGYYTGESATIDEYGTWPPSSTFEPLPVLSEGEFARWDNGAWLVDTVGPQPPVPEKVEMAQARLALLDAGLLSSVAPAIAALQSPDRERAEIEWEYSTVVHRNHGFVLALAPALGLTDQELDNLFIAAESL